MLLTLAAALLAALTPSGTEERTPAEAPATAHATDARAPEGVAPGGAPGTGSVAEGRVESQGARVEILGRPVRVGENRELPEGFIRVEEEGVEDREVGSFSVVPAQTLRPASVAMAEASPRSRRPGSVQGMAEPPATAPPLPSTERPCRRERAAYLSELWKASGIEVADPDAVIEGLESGGSGPASGFYWFALATDPFRPLAWSSGLRARADALSRCVRGD